MNDPIDDKTLQEYLSGNSPLSRRYRELDASDAPAHLDEAVLKQSRDAVSEAPTEQSRLRQSRQRLMRWTVPATLAASAVLVVSIVIESGNRHQVTAPTEVPAAVSVAQEQARNDARFVGDDADKAAAAQPSAAPPPPVEKRSQKLAPSLRAQKPADAAAPAPLAQAPKESEGMAVAAKRMRASPQDSVSPPSVSGDLAPQTAIARPVVPPPAAIVSERAPEPKSAGASAALRREQSAAGAADSRQTADAELQEISVTGSKINRPAQASAGPRGTITQNANVAARSDELDGQPRWRAQPESWLEHIRQLRKDGSAEEADREWERFRAVYPDYPVAASDVARTKR